MAQFSLVVVRLRRMPAAYPKKGRRRDAGTAGDTPATTVYGVGDGLLTAGWGVALDDGTRLPRPVPACCRAVPTLLRMASPSAAWSNVIGPRDSAT